MEADNKEIYNDLQLLFDNICGTNDVNKTLLHKMLRGVRSLLDHLASGESNAFKFMLKWCQVYVGIQRKTVKYVKDYQNSVPIAISYIIGSLQYNTNDINNYHFSLLEAVDELMANATLATLQNIGNLSQYTILCLWLAVDQSGDFNTQFMAIKLMSTILKFSNYEHRLNIIQKICTTYKYQSTKAFDQIIEQAYHCGTFQNVIRDLLINYNNKSTESQVYSLHCISLTFGENYEVYKPLNSEALWLNFNYNPFTLTFEGRFKSNVNEAYEMVKVSINVKHLEVQRNILIVDFYTPIVFSKKIDGLEVLNDKPQIRLQLSEEEANRLKANSSLVQHFNNNKDQLKQSVTPNVPNTKNKVEDRKNDAGYELYKNDNRINSNDSHKLLTTDSSQKQNKILNRKKRISTINNISSQISDASDNNIPMSTLQNNITQSTNTSFKLGDKNKSATKPKRSYNKRITIKSSDNSSDDRGNTSSSTSQGNLNSINIFEIAEQKNSNKPARKPRKRFFQTIENLNDTEKTAKKRRIQKPKPRKPRVVKKANQAVMELEQIVNNNNDNNVESIIGNSKNNHNNNNYDDTFNSNAAVTELNTPTLRSAIRHNGFQLFTATRKNRIRSKAIVKNSSTKKNHSQNTNNSINNTINSSNINESVLLSNQNHSEQTSDDSINFQLIRSWCTGEKTTTTFSVLTPLSIDTPKNDTKSNIENSTYKSNMNTDEKAEEERLQTASNDSIQYDKTRTQDNENTQFDTSNVEIMRNMNLLLQQNLQEPITTSTPLQSACIDNLYLRSTATNSFNRTENTSSGEEDGQLWLTSHLKSYLKNIRGITNSVLKQYEGQQSEILILKRNIGLHLKQLEWLLEKHNRRTQTFGRFKEKTVHLLRSLQVNLELERPDSHDEY